MQDQNIEIDYDLLIENSSKLRHHLLGPFFTPIYLWIMSSLTSMAYSIENTMDSTMY